MSIFAVLCLLQSLSGRSRVAADQMTAVGNAAAETASDQIGNVANSAVTATPANTPGAQQTAHATTSALAAARDCFDVDCRHHSGCEPYRAKTSVLPSFFSSRTS